MGNSLLRHEVLLSYSLFNRKTAPTTMLTTAVFLPTLALLVSCAGTALYVCALRQRRTVRAVLALLVVALSVLSFWRLMDVSYIISAGMVAFCCGVGLPIGTWINTDVSLAARMLRLAVASVGASLPCLAFLWLILPFRMWDEVQDQARSPDGRYTATLCYKDGLTFGFQHVTLDAAGWHLFGGHADIAEADCEGLRRVWWQGNRTLVIDYDGTKHNDQVEDTAFVRQDPRWHDVRIIYRAIHP